MTLIQPVNGFRQGHFLISNSGVSPCKYSVSELVAISGNAETLILLMEVLPDKKKEL